MYGVTYWFYTSAISGSIYTQHFGKKFDADKVERKIDYLPYIYPPESQRNNTNVTLHFDIYKTSMKDLSSSFAYENDFSVSDLGRIYPDIKQISKDYSPPAPIEHNKHISVKVNAILSDVRKQKIDLMPGFKLTWYYTGMKHRADAKYHNEDTTKSFVRNICF